MTTLEKTAANPVTGLAKLWQRLPALVKALLLGFLVNTFGVYGLPVFASLLPLPLALIAVVVFLFLYWKFFSGSWGHQASKVARRKYFRVKALSPTQWRWSLLSALLLVIFFQSGMVVTFRFIEFPAEQFTSVYGLDALPVGIAWVALIIASFSAGLCEETGFRGYGQVPLEERYGPGVAILIGSFLFMIAHLHQAWAPPILLHIFIGGALFGFLAFTTRSLVPGIIGHTLMDICNFSYWWSDLSGKFEYQTLSQTGIDIHFLLSSLICLSSVVLFFWTMRKFKALSGKN